MDDELQCTARAVLQIIAEQRQQIATREAQLAIALAQVWRLAGREPAERSRAFGRRRLLFHIASCAYDAFR